MSVRTYVECDANGCGSRVEIPSDFQLRPVRFDVLPSSWLIRPVDEKHFCSAGCAAIASES